MYNLEKSGVQYIAAVRWPLSGVIAVRSAGQEDVARTFLIMTVTVNFSLGGTTT
jgi:hypothetical protein